MQVNIMMLALVAILLLMSGCSPDGSEDSGEELAFFISDAKSLYIGPPLSKSNGYQKILLKDTGTGKIEEAVSGYENGAFYIETMLVNPVTEELFLLGNFQDYFLIRVTPNNEHYGLSLMVCNYLCSGFDSNGAFYFTAMPHSISAPGEMSQMGLWKYIDGTATSIFASYGIFLKKVMYNGYVIFDTVDGVCWMRSPSGSLIEWGTYWGFGEGVYSSYSDTFYYGSLGYRFDTGTVFSSGAYVGMYGCDFDAADGTFINDFTKYTVQADKTLIATTLLSNYTIATKSDSPCGCSPKIVKRMDDTFYFLGKDGSGKSNIFKLNPSGTVDRLLIGADENGYHITSASINDEGKVEALALRLSNGKYGKLTGDFNTGLYEFIENAQCESIHDVLIF